MQQPIKDGQEGEEAAEGENGKTDGDECDYLVFEIGGQKGRDEVGESEGGQKAERGGEGEEGRGRGETGREDKGRGETEAGGGSKGDTEKEDLRTRETEREDEGEVKIEGEDEGAGEDGGRGGIKEEDGWIGKTMGEMTDDALEELLFISDNSVCPSSSEPLTVTSDPSEQPAAAMLQEAWGHDLGNRDDLSDSHLSDCLQAELAIVYSDSEAGEDQWASFAPCDVANQEEAGGAMHDGVCDGDRKEEGRGGGKEEEDKTGREEQRGEGAEKEQEERRGGRDDDEAEMRSRRDLFLRSPSVSSTASSTDPDRRVRLPPL